MSNRSRYERRKRNVLRCGLKAESDDAHVTSGDRSFHVSATETEKARLPTTVRQKDGIVRRLEEADLSLYISQACSIGF